MVTYSDMPYEEPGSIEEWLEERGGSEAYATVFSWPIEKVHSEYSEFFDRIDKVNQQLRLLNINLKNCHKEWSGYLRNNGFEKWTDPEIKRKYLDIDMDAKHSRKKSEYMHNIKSIQSAIGEINLSSGIEGLGFPIRLLAGIIDGSYSNFYSIIDDEKRTHNLLSAGPYSLIWLSIGPIHNWFWSMYPKLV